MADGGEVIRVYSYNYRSFSCFFAKNFRMASFPRAKRQETAEQTEANRIRRAKSLKLNA